MPAWSFPLLTTLENGLGRWHESGAMFAKIVLRRTAFAQ
jgi:hypothetical protein